MRKNTEHTFHIPVMGLGFTIDTPAKVAHFGISSVVSIVEDHLIEQMRLVLCKQYKFDYQPIETEQQDYRARRITAYLNTLHQIVILNTENLKSMPFNEGSDFCKYFELLPDTSAAKKFYRSALKMQLLEKKEAEISLREMIVPGAIDVNIMTKVDKTNYDVDGNILPQEYSDALSALRGFVNSNLNSSVVFSAGLNPRLYSYCEQFDDFFPDQNGLIRKKIILKVSDYRSALIQGKFLAKKGIWISEFRVESGLNCGGHAFATEGLLLGPILEEFKNKRESLRTELLNLCLLAHEKRACSFKNQPELKISVQGGIGTSEENEFLLKNYNLNATGWGSPFLLVPEATTVDSETVGKLASAQPSDYYLSQSSPLGVPFNNFRHSSSETQRLMRISKNRPGSPCYKKFLSSNTEFTATPICTASREYQNLKLKQLRSAISDDENYKLQAAAVTEKDCLCEGLGTGALLKNNTKLSHGLKAVAICPGPNLAFFSGIFSLKQMVDHIYGRGNILNDLKRPHVFINELKLYVDYFKKEIDGSINTLSVKHAAHLHAFKSNLISGIDYYSSLLTDKIFKGFKEMEEQLTAFRKTLNELELSTVVVNS